jgi:multicomponent Na+:H+ antiporter subunit D
MNSLIPIFVIVPLATAFLIMVIGKFVLNFQKIITPLILLFLTVLSFYFLFNLKSNSLIYAIGGWEPINNIPIAIYFVMDGFSVLLLTIISLIGFLASMYSISYISKFTSENNFYALLCLMITGMNGVVLSGDLFNLFVFLEISVISSYALVAFGTEKEELEASFKYQVLGGIASFLILFGIGLIYWKTKTLNIADISNLLRVSEHGVFEIFVQILLLSGFGLKAAMIPFHAWLPDAHSSAPSPISAMLSGVLIKAAGIYVIIRLFFNMFVTSEEIAILITTLGTISMVIGVLLAIGQWDIKRLLAYHSISQMGYVVLSIGIGLILMSRGTKPVVAALAIAGGLFHMINHAVFKGLLFLNAGAIEHRLNTRNLKEMGGLSHDMPTTSATAFVASMSISGIPPFNGFFSKLIIIIAAVQAKFYLIAALAVFVSIITLASFMKFQRYAFFDKKEHSIKVKEVPLPMIFSMVVMGILCLLFSLLAFPGIREQILGPAIDVLMKTGKYAQTIIGI